MSWKWKSLSCVGLFATPWTLQSMEFSRPESWSGWPIYPFSSRSFQPRNWTRVSCIAGIFFTNWAIREVLNSLADFQSLTSCWKLTLMCKGLWWILLLSTMMCVCVCVCVWPSCVWLCNPMTCSFPCSSVHGIFWIRILQWAAIPFSRGSPQPIDWTWVFIIWTTREARNTLDHSFTCLLLVPGC